MLSDESSSDSETGRFKGQSEKQVEQTKKSNPRDNSTKSTGRNKIFENHRFRREFDRKRDERDRFERHSRDRYNYSRHSPVRRRRSREKSPNKRRSRERHRYDRDIRARSKQREHRSNSKDRRRHSRSRSHKSPEHRKDLKEVKQKIPSSDRSIEKLDEKSSQGQSLSPDFKGKRSEIHKPTAAEPVNKKRESPIIVEEHGDSDLSEVVQPGSYYSMIPAIVKDKSEESSEIDSSDDERLRAKLLNLEKELHKTRKKKHKKKHKRKSSKSSKEREKDIPISGEVSSTTDIQDKLTAEASSAQVETVEVTSTQKNNQKESGEEGEILSDNDSQYDMEIDPHDLRHKLKRSVQKTDTTESPDLRDRLKTKPDVCGPVLPPHLEKRFKQNDVEGPALPPHLQKQDKNIGPSITEDMRKTLSNSEREVIKYESSEEDVGIGPLPVGAEDKWSEAHQRLEERALDMKIKKLDGQTLQNSDVKSREQWMLELPEAKAKYLGLEARTFRAKEGPDMSDRSCWTDTPEEKARKAVGVIKDEDADAALQREARARHIANRDEEQEKAIKKHKKKHKREDSLLELHQKKLKKKKKKDEKEEGKKERRPFSRDLDLQVNRFDEAQKKSIIKKAQDLNTRFSRGEAKYL